MSITIINIFINAMEIYLKYFVVGNLNLCDVLNVVGKILEMYNLNLGQ
jgi:hypothetical protein